MLEQGKLLGTDLAMPTSFWSVFGQYTQFLQAHWLFSYETQRPLEDPSLRAICWLKGFASLSPPPPDYF